MPSVSSNMFKYSTFWNLAFSTTYVLVTIYRSMWLYFWCVLISYLKIGHDNSLKIVTSFLNIVL